MKNGQIFEWDYDVKVIQNPFVMKQLYMAFGIPSLFLWLLLSVLAITEGSDLQSYFVQVSPALYVFLGFMILSYLIIVLVFRNNYPMTFRVDAKKMQ